MTNPEVGPNYFGFFSSAENAKRAAALGGPRSRGQRLLAKGRQGVLRDAFFIGVYSGLGAARMELFASYPCLGIDSGAHSAKAASLASDAFSIAGFE